MTCVFHVWVGVGGQEEFEQDEVVQRCCLAFSLMVSRSGTGRGIGGGGMKEEKCWIHNRLIKVHIPFPLF